jgi:hypothetical protein
MSGSNRPAIEADVLELKRILHEVVEKEGATAEGIAYLRGLKTELLDEFSAVDTADEAGDVLEWKRTPMGVVGTRYAISKMPGRRGLWLRTRFRLACLALGEYGRPRLSLRELRERTW